MAGRTINKSACQLAKLDELHNITKYKKTFRSFFKTAMVLLMQIAIATGKQEYR